MGVGPQPPLCKALSATRGRGRGGWEAVRFCAKQLLAEPPPPPHMQGRVASVP